MKGNIAMTYHPPTVRLVSVLGSKCLAGDIGYDGVQCTPGAGI